MHLYLESSTKEDWWFRVSALTRTYHKEWSVCLRNFLNNNNGHLIACICLIKVAVQIEKNPDNGVLSPVIEILWPIKSARSITRYLAKTKAYPYRQIGSALTVEHLLQNWMTCVNSGGLFELEDLHRAFFCLFTRTIARCTHERRFYTTGQRNQSFTMRCMIPVYD